MKIYTFGIIYFLLSPAIADKNCRGLYFDDRYHDIQILKDGLNHVHKIILNSKDNTVYFIFDEISTFPNRLLGYYNITTQQSGVVDGIRNASSIAVDQIYNIVYAGGYDGIFIINEKKVPEKLPIIDNIQSLFYKDVLYYTNKEGDLFKYKNGITDYVEEVRGVKVANIIVDDDYNFFFTQDRTLFRIKMNTKALNTHERYRVNFIATDAYYKPYIGTKDGVFKYNKYKYSLDKVSSLNNLKGLTFNKINEPIYSTSDLLVKLNFNPASCHEFY